jgi:UMF1 family MFS transporter
MQKNNPTILNAWAMYDWANSAHNLVITSAIFPAYFTSITKNTNNGMINFLGMSFKNSVLFTYSISLAFLMIIFLHPFLSSLADFTGKKKSFMRFFVYLGVVSTASLFWIDKTNVHLGLLFFMLSLIGYSGSLVFYNAYLPEIATEDKFNFLSAKGFTLGYVGSVLLMSQNLTMIELPHLYGNILPALACQISFLLVGIWWWIFGEYTLYYLPSSASESQKQWLKKGFSNIQKVSLAIFNQKSLYLFLIAFFFYSMGLQTVMFVAAIFAEVELKIPEGNLIATILLLQLLAIVGAYMFAYSSEKRGNFLTLKMGTITWGIICIFAYFITQSSFYILATCIGVVMGGMQSLSRATFTKLMPPKTTEKSSYFAFYEITEKLALVLGTFSFGFIEQLTGNVRNSILALTIYFVIGLSFLILAQKKSFLQ